MTPRRSLGLNARTLSTLTLKALSASLLIAGAGAQGADDCTMPQAIAGVGPHSFDTTAASTDGLPDGLCNFAGSDDIFDDVWFRWTAIEDGPHVLSMCGGFTTGDTKVAVYDGSCAGAIIACNDDSCGLISELSFNALNGTTYAFRIGNFAAGGASIGDFTVTLNAPILNPNNGHFYQLVDEQLSWNGAKLAAEGQIWQGLPGHLVTIQDQVELDWILSNLNPGRPWIGLSQNLNSPTYAEPDGGYEWVTGEPFTFINWAAGEPSDTSASGGSEEYVELFGNGEWNDAEDAHIFTNQYLVEWDGMGTLGTNYCMANVNSTGSTADISAEGSLTVADNDLTLTATNLPPLGFGFFIVSQTEGFVPGPGGSSGNFCLGGSVGRYVGPGQIQNSGSLGQIDLPIDLTQIPQPNGFVSVAAGHT